MYGGKSYWLRWALVVLSIYFFRKYKKEGIVVGLFCEDYPALKDRHLSKIDMEFPTWLGTSHGDHKAYGKSFVLAKEYGGGVIVFRNLDDPSKYASAEFAAIAVDELTKNTLDKFIALRHRLRWPGINDVKFIAGTNPGGIGHAWVKKMFMDKEFEPEEQEADKFCYVPAKYTDNPNKNPGYEATLNSLPPTLAKAFRDGNWDTFEGQYFEKFNREIHTCKPFQVPTNWMRFLWMDYGYRAPSCVHWAALDEAGRLYVYRELYTTGLTYRQLARKIEEMTPEWEKEMLEGNMVADPAIYQTKGEDSEEKNGAEQMSEETNNWLNFRRGNNNRIVGWGVMREYIEPFKYDDQITARLIYFETCPHAIRTVPALVYDSVKLEDVDTKGEDHCLVGDTLLDLCDGKVFTTRGLSKFYNPRKTRKAQIIKITLEDGREIKSTTDHRFLTTNGWKKAKEIDEKVDMVIQLGICEQKSYQKQFKNLMGKDFISVEDIFRKTEEDYTLQCGNFTMEKLKKVITFIIKTEIGKIIISKIWKKLRKANIYLYTQKEKKILSIALSNYQKQEKKLKNGISQKKGENGIQNTQKNWLKSGLRLLKFAMNVVKNMKQQNSFLISQSIAIKIAKLERCEEEEVYNITVPRGEQYTINGGIISHNCGDADRYGIMDVHEMYSEKAPEPPTEVTTTDQIKKRDLQAMKKRREEEENDIDWLTM